MNLAHTKEQVNFSHFSVWYKYKTASQKLLDSWKDKRTTGFRLSWRIENPTLKWTTSISEVGKSIKSPLRGDSYAEAFDASSDLVYKAILTLPKDLQQQMRNESLVIEFDVDMGHSDEMSAYTSYKLYREMKSKSEGGQLASIHSLWEQTLAEEAAEGKRVWLGGRKSGNQWEWADNSTWSFTNWKRGHPADYGYLRMERQWYDLKNSITSRFLCKGKAVTIRDNGFASIELKKEELTFFPFHVVLKSQAIGERKLNRSSEEKRRIPGFTLNWFLKDSNGTELTKKLAARQDDWKEKVPTAKYEPFFVAMIQLARHLRIRQNMTREQILDKIVQKKAA